MKAKRHTKLWEWQLKAKEGGQCEKCNKDGKLTVDHRVPQSLCGQLGAEEYIYDEEVNFMLACPACNTFKGNRIDITDEIAVSILYQIVKKLWNNQQNN